MDRVWSKINKTDDCWLWTAAKDKRGYGRININQRSCLAHRVVWEMEVSLIPPDMTLDHLCSRIDCVRPDHLEVVTRSENNKRQWQRSPASDRCPRDHEPNWRYESSGARRCRTCYAEKVNTDEYRAWQRAYRAGIN